LRKRGWLAGAVPTALIALPSLACGSTYLESLTALIRG
jgi:hypothetical protein